MAHKEPSRVRETTITTGTGAYALGGAATGFRAFSDALAEGDTCDIVVVMGANYEIARVTLTSGTLVRTAVLKSSNGGAAVDWPAGTKDIAATRAGLSDQDAVGIALILAVLGVGGAKLPATVRAATTANVTIATALNDSDTLDGVSLATGDLVLVKDQSAAAENGIYIVGATPERWLTDYDAHVGLLAVVQEGSTNADTLWLCSADEGGTLDTTAIAFAAFSTSGFLPLAGGTMTGDLGMGNNAINNANSIETRADIKHYQDADTYIRFSVDQIDFHAGGVTFVQLIEDTDDYVTFLDNEVRRPKLRDYGETVSAHGNSGSGTEDFDLEAGNVHTVTITGGTVTVTFSNPPASGTAGSLTIIITNGGSQTVNWPAAVDWAGGTAPTLTASGVDVLTFITTDGGTTWLGFAGGLDMQ